MGIFDFFTNALTAVGTVAESVVRTVAGMSKGNSMIESVSDFVSTAADILFGSGEIFPRRVAERDLSAFALQFKNISTELKMAVKKIMNKNKRPQVSMVIFQHVSYFNFDSFGTILFNFWDYNSIGDIALSCLGILAMTFLMESIQFIREINRARYELKHPPVPLKQQHKMKLHVDILDAFLHFLYLGLGGLLFLVMLTYHVVLYLAVILGIAFSHGFYRLICPNLRKFSFFA